MPFLAPALPFIAKAGAALGGSLLGSKLSKQKLSPAEQLAQQQEADVQKTSLDLGKSLVPQAQNLFSMGTGAMAQPINYWASLLSGNRGLATSAAAPEIGRINEGYDAATKASTLLNPRGGTSAAFNAETPYARQRDVSTLLQTARPEAAKNLFGAGSEVSGRGSNILSQAVNSILSSTQAGRDILNSEAMRKATEAERGKSIGAGIFDMLKKYGFPAIDAAFAGRGGGGGGSEAFLRSQD